METSVHFADSNDSHIQTVAMLRPLHWLQQGWRDWRLQPAPSLAYGLLVTGLGYVVLMLATTHIYLMAAAVSGFLLIGPVMATGLCELSRRRARHEAADFDISLDALERNKAALLHFAVILFAISVSWFLLSVLLLHVLLGHAAPPLDATLWGDFLVAIGPLQAAAYLLVGGLLALLVFVLSVVSVPAIIDRDSGALAAMRLSARVVGANWPAMLVWAALIVALTALGFASFLLALIVIYPLLGYATWHAYEDMVGQMP